MHPASLYRSRSISDFRSQSLNGVHLDLSSSQQQDGEQASPNAEPEMFFDALEGTVEALADLHQAFGTHSGASSKSDDFDDYRDFDVGEVKFMTLQRLHHLLPVRNDVVLRDKLSFVLGSTMMWYMAHWLGRSPHTFYRLYSAAAVLLGAVRYASYRRKGWHYYLFDFCYYANMLLLVHLWLLPKSETLNKVLFAYCAGPLMWSVLTFRNSLVYHDIDKVTSLFMHLGPALVVWTLRWFPDQRRFTWAGRDRRAEGGLGPLVLTPSLPYLAWALAYYLKIFVVSAAKIRRRGYHTLFTYVTQGRGGGMFASITRRISPQLRPVAYLLCHLTFCLITFAVSVGAWRSYAVHTALLTAMSCVSLWHGASYYFDVFAHRYLASRGIPQRPGGAEAKGGWEQAHAGARAKFDKPAGRVRGRKEE